MILIIDRFEGNYAVCEKKDKTIINISLEKLPKEAKEGDVIRIEENIISVDIYETKKRREEIEEIVKDIWQ